MWHFDPDVAHKSTRRAEFHLGVSVSGRTPIFMMMVEAKSTAKNQEFKSSDHWDGVGRALACVAIRVVSLFGTGLSRLGQLLLAMQKSNLPCTNGCTLSFD